MSVSEPGKIITPWAESGLKNPIPPTANPATGRAGFDQGFSAINMTAKEAGGIPPFGQDFNGIFYEVTSILRYMQAGGQPTFSPALAAAIGGYPKGSMVLGSDGVTLWQSKVDSNSTDPNVDPANWGTFDIGLKADLAEPGGSDIVGFQQAGAGSAQRTSQDKMREKVTPQDKGAVGDGVANDQVAFDALEAMPAGLQVDLLGKTYLVTTYPTVQRYYNGSFIVGGVTVEANRNIEGFTRNSNVAVGVGAGASLPQNPTSSSGTSNTIVGENALPSAVSARSNVAIGTGSQFSNVSGRYNDSIGIESLYYVNADGTTYGGTRNTAVGANSGRFITHGYQNIMMGRNAGQGMVLSNHMVALGADCMAGRGSLKFKDSQYIQNMTPINTNNSVAIGYSASYYGSGNGHTAVGYTALGNAKSDASNCTAIGADALQNLGINTGIHGKVQVADTRTGTYVMTATDVTFTLPAHGFSVGWYVVVSLTSGVPYPDGQYYQITSVIDANTFTVSEPLGVITSGTFSMISYETATNQTSSGSNTAIGRNAMVSVAYGTENVAIGNSSNPVNTGGSSNTSVGDLTMSYAVGSSQNTAIGYLSLRTMVDGSQATTLTNCTGLGYNARVSGANQVQLGNASTTTYVFGTVQNRSDARDKTDVRDTKLGIDFIMGLRPVDGRWDMRDDYLEEYEHQIGIDPETSEPIFETRLRKLEHDGSKKRERFHHWFIAQEVKDLCDRLGVEFGGYQDHSVMGGSDVLSLGYDEFIPPLTKAVQDCWNEIESIKERLDAAGL